MAFVEDRLNQPDSEDRQRWFRRFVDGDIVGSGWSETGSVRLGDVNTTVSPTGHGWQLTGEKFYSTGTLYADWIDVYAKRTDNQRDVIAVVSTHQDSVERDDDWDGFGQRLTGSGTTRFREAHVEPAHVYDFSERFRYQTAFISMSYSRRWPALVALLCGMCPGALHNENAFTATVMPARSNRMCRCCRLSAR